VTGVKDDAEVGVRVWISVRVRGSVRVTVGVMVRVRANNALVMAEKDRRRAFGGSSAVPSPPASPPASPPPFTDDPVRGGE
jgi:hypothetical protein